MPFRRIDEPVGTCYIKHGHGELPMPEAAEPNTIRVALPAYNEAASLPALVERWAAVLRGLDRPFRILIVDDGSSDATPSVLAELAQRFPLEIHRHAANQGLGMTIRDALVAAAAQAAPDDVIATMDADGTHPPELFPPMLDRLQRDRLDVVIASRYEPGAQVVGLSGLRRLTTSVAGVLFRVVLPVRGVRDYTCGYRLYRAACLQRAIGIYSDRFVEERSFACMAEILLKLARLGARCGEVPLVLRYDLKGGTSKMRVLTTIVRTLRLICRQRCAPSRPRPSPRPSAPRP